MFLTIRHDDDRSMVEVLDLPQLFDPFEAQVLGRLHAGEELQEPQPWPKAELRFPSGEALPGCWIHPPRREPAEAPGTGWAAAAEGEEHDAQEPMAG
jgi:hypothetical protein